MNRNEIDIERAVLGEALAFDELHQKVMLLEPEDFLCREHAVLCKAMRDCAKKDVAFDFITIANMCGSEYREIIQACVQIAVSAVMFEEHLRILKETASKRRLINRFNQLTIEDEVSVSTLQKIVDDENTKRLVNNIKQTNEKNIDAFIHNLNLKKGSIMTGFGTIDKILGGIRKSTVFIVGARPSTGKTTFALNIAANQLKDEMKRVLFFSLEMSAEMIYERLAASQCLIEYERFSRNELTDADIQKVAEQSLKIREEGRFVVVDDVYNAEYICNLITENRPSLAVVDFMQIISSTGRFDNVRSRIDYISSLFKRTAKATGCVILVLSQLSRVGKDAPTMSDLKESGGLEQDGDYIALMHRPYVLNKGDNSITPEQTELLLDKNKFGRTGKVNLHFDLKHQRFSETLQR